MGQPAAAIARKMLQAYAVQDKLSERFVIACLCISAWESAFDPLAQNALDPGPWGSVGLWQLNSQAYPELTRVQAENPFYSTFWWLYHQGAERRWRDMGGEDGFGVDPIGFLRQWAPAVQVSDPWTESVAQTAIRRTGGALLEMAEQGWL